MMSFVRYLNPIGIYSLMCATLYSFRLRKDSSFGKQLITRNLRHFALELEVKQGTQKKTPKKSLTKKVPIEVTRSTKSCSKIYESLSKRTSY